MRAWVCNEFVKLGGVVVGLGWKAHRRRGIFRRVWMATNAGLKGLQAYAGSVPRTSRRPKAPKETPLSPPGNRYGTRCHFTQRAPRLTEPLHS